MFRAALLGDFAAIAVVRLDLECKNHERVLKFAFLVFVATGGEIGQTYMVTGLPDQVGQ